MKKLEYILVIIGLFNFIFYAQAKPEAGVNEEEPFERMLPSSDQITIIKVNPIQIDPKDFKSATDQPLKKNVKTGN